MSVWIDCTIMTTSHEVALCTTKKIFHKQLRRLGVSPRKWPDFIKNAHSHGTLHEIVDKKGKFFALLCIKAGKKTDPNQIVGLLVHEAVHVWQWHCENIGEENPGAEQEAYAIQHIVQNLLVAYSQQTKGKSDG